MGVCHLRRNVATNQARVLFSRKRTSDNRKCINRTRRADVVPPRPHPRPLLLSCCHRSGTCASLMFWVNVRAPCMCVQLYSVHVHVHVIYDRFLSSQLCQRSVDRRRCVVVCGRIYFWRTFAAVRACVRVRAMFYNRCCRRRHRVSVVVWGR